MGGGTTSLAVFYDGQLVHVDVVPLGGAHVTNDIARGLSTPLAHAERLKTLYGTVLPSPSDDTETIDVPQVGETDEHAHNQVPRSILTGIIKPRLEETIERSEEHTSELQSLMRISYAVFCLKKNKSNPYKYQTSQN